MKTYEVEMNGICVAYNCRQFSSRELDSLYEHGYQVKDEESGFYIIPDAFVKKMPFQLNGWEHYGGDGERYWKYKGERVYTIISMEWLDGDDDYAIITADVDLKELSLHDIEIAICGSFNGITDMEERTGCVLGELDVDIALEYFDTNCICDSYSWGDTYSEEDAKLKVIDYILRN